MQGRIIRKESFQVVGLPWTGPYTMSRELNKLWEVFLKRVNEIPHQTDPGVFVCPCHDRVTDFTCYIAVEVSRVENVPAGMVALTVPTQTYAVFTHRGPIRNVPTTYQKAWKWIERKGFRKDHSTLGLEIYNHHYIPVTHDPAAPDNMYEILIPIKRP